MEYITTKEASSKWGISTIRITVLANEGRIPGAKRLGKSWLIPADASKPEALKARRPGSKERIIDDFSFPLYHYRSDWIYIKGTHLSKEQQRLLEAETAVVECRFKDAYSILESILQDPYDTVIEIGALWNAGICCVALNKPKDFSRVFLRLQILLSADFPHRDDLVIILYALNTYVETLGAAAITDTVYNTNIHNQALPMTCMLIGYNHMSREAMNLERADTTLLEMNLRLLSSSGTAITEELMHCYLLGIYYLRQDMEKATKHAEAVVQIAYENKFYYPLVTYYSYFAPLFSSILEKYPMDFQKHCHKLTSSYNKNFTSFMSSINEQTLTSKLSNDDFPYIYTIIMGLTIPRIAENLGVSEHTVKRKIAKICEKLGVNSKKNLRDYLYSHM